MIIDGHVHLWLRPMYPDVIINAYLEPWLELAEFMDMTRDKEENFPTSEVRPETLVEYMGRGKVDRSVILPLDFGTVEEPKVGVEAYNDWVFKCAEDYPDKLIPFMGIDPTRGEQALKLMRKYHSKYEPRGIKIYPPNGFYPYEERLDPFWKEVKDMGLTVVTHAGASWGPLDEEKSRPIHFRKVLERYPEINVIIAHLGGKYRADTYELAAEFDNLYTDCSALQGWLPSEPGVVIDRMKEAFSHMGDRVIFGSDWPLFDLSYPYESWCCFAKEQPFCSEDRREKLLGGTMQKLLGL
ncbi:MAG TPA: amidohydrolase family protein [Methanomassiliicoccales archaeon]|nr:amidohydrolase family protein [Methanomassiliicoccales archaeon]